MFKPELENIKDTLLLELSDIFDDHGYILSKGSDDSFKGITDDIPFYFYLDFLQNENQIRFFLDESLGVKDAYTIDADFKLIARFTNVNIYNAVTVMFNCLASINGVEIKSINTDAENIIRAETGDKLKKCNFQLIQIDFEIEKCIFASKGCLSISCDENSC